MMNGETRHDLRHYNDSYTKQILFSNRVCFINEKYSNKRKKKLS